MGGRNMRLRVDFQDGTLEFDGAEDQLVAAFEGPADAPAAPLPGRLRDALDAPTGYPPLRLVVVPGDRVVVPVDRGLPDADAFLAAVAAILRDADVASITALVDGREAYPRELALPTGVDLVVHDPADRESLAYLANTEAGRRIYLQRLLADADCVVPIGRIGLDSTGYRGPWSVIEPGLGDSARPAPALLDGRDPTTLGLDESIEVSWLLGSGFQVGGIPGRLGTLHVLAGETRAIRDRGVALLEESWRVTADDRADLVIVGVGGPGRAASAEGLVAGLRNAFRVVRRGGKVALLTRAGIATIREAVADDLLPEGDWARAQAWADVYLASTAPADEVDDLGFVPLDRPEQAVRLANAAPSLVTIGQADFAFATAPPR